MNIYVVIVISSGIVSFFLQCLSLVTLGWLQINIDVKTVTVQSHSTIKVGLWQAEACVDLEQTVNATTNETCVTMSRSSLERVLTGNQGQGAILKSKRQRDAEFVDFDILPYLVVTAFCCSILGLGVFLFQFSSCCTKDRIRVEIVSMLFWLIAVGVLVTTVSIGGHLSSFLSYLYKAASSSVVPQKLLPPGYVSLEMSVNFPYSIMVSGIGMAFCFVNTAAIVVDICVTKFKRSTDYWKYERVHLSEDHERVELMSDGE